MIWPCIWADVYHTGGEESYNFGVDLVLNIFVSKRTKDRTISYFRAPLGGVRLVRHEAAAVFPSAVCIAAAFLRSSPCMAEQAFW